MPPEPACGRSGSGLAFVHVDPLRATHRKLKCISDYDFELALYMDRELSA